MGRRGRVDREEEEEGESKEEMGEGRTERGVRQRGKVGVRDGEGEMGETGRD